MQNSHQASDSIKNTADSINLYICIQNTATVHESSSNWVKKILITEINMNSVKEMLVATSEYQKTTSDILSITCSSLLSY